MAYLRRVENESGLGYLGCGSGCSCAPCRRGHATLGEWYVPEREEREPAARRAPEGARLGEACTPAPGIPNTDCSAYFANRWWLPLSYVNNATCACRSTPNSPTANCVRKILQDRLAKTPFWLKSLAAGQRGLPSYPAFVQSVLTPRIYRDHVDAYRRCCCPSGPAPYWSWAGVTAVPIQPCSLVGAAIRRFGSCHGTPGRW